jgi:hypothetical protein
MSGFSVLAILLVCCLTIKYIGGTVLQWWCSYTLKWPKSLTAARQAAICKAYFLRNGIKANLPRNLGTKHQLEIQLARRRVFLCFASATSPPTRVLFEDLSEFRQKKFPSGNGSVAVICDQIENSMAFDWSNEFHVPILRPRQIAQLVALFRSPPDTLADAIFEMSLAPAARKALAEQQKAKSLLF